MLSDWAGRLCSEKEGNSGQTRQWTDSCHSAVHTQLGCAVCGFGACAVVSGAAKFRFSFPGLPSGKPPKLLRSSGVQFCLYCLWPWYSTLITQALTKWKGPPQAQIQVRTSARRAIVITGSPLQSPRSLGSYSPKPWRTPWVEGIRIWDRVGRALSKSRKLGFFPSSEGPWARHQISFCLHFLIHEMYKGM